MGMRPACWPHIPIKTGGGIGPWMPGQPARRLGVAPGAKSCGDLFTGRWDARPLRCGRATSPQGAGMARFLQEFAMSLAVDAETDVYEPRSAALGAPSFAPHADAPVPVQRGSFPLRLTLRNGGCFDVVLRWQILGAQEAPLLV